MDVSDASRPSINKLQDLAAQYARLNKRTGMTPQERGRLFNGLLAEMFQAWGHKARADLNKNGNIDVAVSIGRQRFVLEAKWEADKTSIGPISKLQKRVRQRLAGTIGLFVSMSGYTPDALHDIKDGERLEVVLLDRAHVEAMLTGFCPPSELLNLLLDRSHFYGDPTTSLEVLLTNEVPPPDLIFGDECADGMDPLREASDQVSAEWVIRGVPFGQSGLSVLPDGCLLVVSAVGMLEVDAARQRVELIATPNEVTHVRVLRSGAIAVVRRHGVALVSEGKISILGGPFADPVSFVEQTGDEVVVLSAEPPQSRGINHSRRPVVSTLGSCPGEEVSTTIESPGGQGTAAVRLQDGRLVLMGGSPTLIRGSMVETAIPIQTSNPFEAVAAFDGQSVLAAGGDVDLFRVNVEEQVSARLCSLYLAGAAIELTMVPGSLHEGYVMAMYPGDGDHHWAVIRFKLQDVR